MTTRYRPVGGVPAMSPESAMASDLFDQFVAASTFKTVLATYRQICEVLRIKPSNFPNFYPKLKSKLRSWKAASLWGKLDKRASHKCYNRGKACPNTRVLIIGAGPCGLRTAIEAQLLGAKVVVLEKRDRFSRNNVLHLWPFVIIDLRNLGGKKFFGKFCAGDIDHISIRQLQLILLKVALLLGVEVHENVTFCELLDPPQDQSYERIGWRSRVQPPDHPVSQYEFDVLIGADGKRNTLLGFNRKEFRGKLAIAVTANFINRQTIEEARVTEISGVSFIFNQMFFQEMREDTGIDLENIVYYKDDTHYFVMTAKKQSLLDRGVIVHDYSDTGRLLSPGNVDRQALMEYARDAADFATKYKMPHFDFAVNHYGQADVAMFDFTSMYAAENACRIVERRGHKLIQGLVGDCLLEPFWPTGSGCARGFLSALDAGWMTKCWASGKMTPLQVIAEREAVYRLLAQTTPENLSKDINQYTLNPSSRYPNLNLKSVLPAQVRSLCDTDADIQDQLPDVVPEMPRKKKKRESYIHTNTLLAWCQRQVALSSTVSVQNMTTSWKSGMVLCTIIHRYRPDLIDIASLNPEDAAKNNQLAFDICEKEFGIPPVMTGVEMAECNIPDELAMTSYITHVYDTFRGEIPYLVRPQKSDDIHANPEANSHTTTSRAILNKISHRLQHRKRYSLERESGKEKDGGEGLRRTKMPSTNVNKRRSREKDKGIALSLENDVTLTSYKALPRKDGSCNFSSKVKSLQRQLRRDEGLKTPSGESGEDPEEMRAFRTRKPQLIGKIARDDWNVKMLEEQLRNRGKVTSKSPSPKVGRLRKDEWNIKMLEEKMHQQQVSPLKECEHKERPKILKDVFESKLQSMDSRLQAKGGLTEEEKAKYGQFDDTVKELERQLKDGKLETGIRGLNRVAAMAHHIANKLEWKPSYAGEQPPAPPPPVLNSNYSSYLKKQPSAAVKAGSSDLCSFCGKRLYLMERLSAEGMFFHRQCFKCAYCESILRLGNYSFDRTSATEGKFYCPPHFRMQNHDQRQKEIFKRKAEFLAGTPQPVVVLASMEPNENVPSSPKEAQPDVTLDGTPQQESSGLQVPLGGSGDGRDRTPERAEFENSLVELSEDELLTSELEEEELTQKNFGGTHEVATSEDEFSDLSTDTESEEEYLKELQLSLTADGTRKLAETWEKRYRTEEESESSTAEAESDTETETGGDDTSNDIESDMEYSSDENIGHDEVDKFKKKSSVGKTDVVVEVPVLEHKGELADSEEFTPSESEDDELGGLGSDECTTEEETDEEDQKLTPLEIPTIVIDESPPQVNTEDEIDHSSTLPEETILEGDEGFVNLDGPSEKLKNVCSNSVSQEIEKIAAEVVSSILEEACKNISKSFVDLEMKGKTEMQEKKEHALVQTKTEYCQDEHVEEKALKESEVPLIELEEKKPLSELQMTKQSQEPVEASNFRLQNIVSAPDVPTVLKKEQTTVGGDTPPPSPVSGLQHSASSRTIQDKFRFITGSPSPPTTWSRGNKLQPSLSSKEIALKLDEFRKKIEDLQKQLPSPPVTISPPKPDFTQRRELFSSSNVPSQCDIYYQSMQADSAVNKPPKAMNNAVDEKPIVISPSKPQSKSVTIMNKDVTGKEEVPTKMLEKDKDETCSGGEIPPSHMQNTHVSDLNLVEIEEAIVAEFKPSGDEKVTDAFIENTSEYPVSLPGPDIAVQQASSSSSSHSLEMGVTSPDSAVVTSPDFVFPLTEETKPLITPEPLTPSSQEKELSVMGQKYGFDPAFITIRRRPHAQKDSSPDWEGTTEESNLNSPEKQETIANLPLSPVRLPSRTSFNSSEPDIHSRCSGADTEQRYKISSSKISPNTSPSTDSRFQGYRGSFAEKVRPRSFMGEAIYLKTLDINLQKVQFPSLSKGSPTFGGSCTHLKEDSPSKTSKHRFSGISSGSKSTEDILLGGKFEDTSTEEEAQTPVTPKPKEETRVITTSTLPKMGTKRKHLREQRWSIQETCDRVPFADDEKQSICGESMYGSCEDVFPQSTTLSGTFFTPPSTLRKRLEFPIEQAPLLEDDERFRNYQSASQEKARKEARERARMKSDEELGLSPCQYRKRYFKSSSLSLGNYDELSSEDYLGMQDDEIEDDSVSDIMELVEHKKDSLTLAKSSSVAQKPETSKSVIVSVSSVPYVCSAAPSASNEIITPKTRGSSEPPLAFSSSDSSPEGGKGNTSGLSKSKGKLKFRIDRKSEDKDSEDKTGKTNNGKKLLLSLLSFGKNGGPKDKAKNKRRSSSMPPDLSSRNTNKEKGFQLLKFNKSRENLQEKKTPGDSTSSSDNGFKAPLSPPPVVSVPPVQQPTQSPLRPILKPQHRLHPLSSATDSTLAPRASVDSFTDTEEEASRAHSHSNSTDKKEKAPDEKEKKALKLAQKVQKQQEMKRLRTAQEINRRLEEIEVAQRDLELKGVALEKALRSECGKEADQNKMTEWLNLIHQKNKLAREEQELLIRVKDLELEERHSRLQQEMRERMAVSDTQKGAGDIEEERKMLKEMLEIVEQRCELVAKLNQLKLREEDKSLGAAAPTDEGKT